MPGVGLQSLRVQRLCLHHRIMVDTFFQDYRQQGCPECQHAWCLQEPASRPYHNLFYTTIHDANGHDEQSHADDGHRQRLILPMPIVVRLVLRLTADTDEHQHNNIGDKVRQRVDGISHHRSTMPQNASHELKDEQHHVDHPSDKGYLIYFFIPFHTFGAKINIIFVSTKKRSYQNAYIRKKVYLWSANSRGETARLHPCKTRAEISARLFFPTQAPSCGRQQAQPGAQ